MRNLLHVDGKPTLHIAILALQGNYNQHARMLQAIASKKNLYTKVQDFRLKIKFIRNKDDIQDIHSIDALILPGGESSTVNKLIQEQQLQSGLRSLIENKIPVLASCSGCILLAKSVYAAGKKEEASVIAHYDIELERNAYGRQLHSFYANTQCIDTRLQKQGIHSLKGLFIRAPRVKKESTHTLRPLFTHNEDIVVLGDDASLIATFHPEAVPDFTLHKLFVQNIVQKYTKSSDTS